MLMKRVAGGSYLIDVSSRQLAPGLSQSMSMISFVYSPV